MNQLQLTSNQRTIINTMLGLVDFNRGRKIKEKQDINAFYLSKETNLDYKTVKANLKQLKELF